MKVRAFLKIFNNKFQSLIKFQVLTKHYKLRHGPNPDSPLEYDGPEIVSCTGREMSGELHLI